MKTQEELAIIKEALSQTHKPVYTLTIDLDDEGTETATIFLKKYDRTVLAATQKIATSGDSLRATETFLKATYIGGDELAPILANIDALRSCEGAVIEMISVKKAKLSKN